MTAPARDAMQDHTDGKHATAARWWPAASVTLIFATQIALVILLGWANRHQISPDAVAYLRIASYYAEGETGLMVSGYWGPMLSWLIGALLSVVSEPLYAARLVMGVSAIVFTMGSFAVLRALTLPPLVVRLGTAVAAFASAVYSAQEISPDLLVSGLICLGASRLLGPSWLDRRSGPIVTGVLFGVAYYAKAVALPVGVTLTGIVTVLAWTSGTAPLRVAGRRAAMTVLALAVTVAPWGLVLSLEYGRPVLSTTARIAHTVPGPRDVDRAHPLGTTIAAPEAGRITWWEDPTEMPYRHWSPFASVAYLRHQLGVIVTNTRLIGGYLASFDRLHLGLFAAGVGLLLHLPWRRNLATDRWRWAGACVLGLCVLYLPVYALGLRYYYAAIPFLFAAAAGGAIVLTRRRGPALRFAAMTLVVASFATPPLLATPALLDAGGRRPAAMILGARLRSHDLTGPIVGDTMEGMLTAYFADTPFHGGFPAATIETYRDSGASLLLTLRTPASVAVLADARGFEDLDALLFESRDEAAAFPLHIHRIVPDAATERRTDGATEGGRPHG